MTHLKDENGKEQHCSSCHEDLEYGYTYYDDFWDYDAHGEEPPKNQQYCCCSQYNLSHK